MDALLSERLATPDVWIWVVEADGRCVGTVWLGIRGSAPWLYDITIDADERGRADTGVSPCSRSRTRCARSGTRA